MLKSDVSEKACGKADNNVVLFLDGLHNAAWSELSRLCKSDRFTESRYRRPDELISVLLSSM